jgi:hypothetical protein
MEMMRTGTVHIGPVAAEAERIPVGVYPSAVGLVAILAYHPCLVHFTLKVGSINIHLVLDLPVGKIEILLQQGRPVGIQQGASMVVIFGGHSSPGVATGTHLDQLIRFSRYRSAGIG